MKEVEKKDIASVPGGYTIHPVPGDIGPVTPVFPVVPEYPIAPVVPVTPDYTKF